MTMAVAMQSGDSMGVLLRAVGGWCQTHVEYSQRETAQSWGFAEGKLAQSQRDSTVTEAEAETAGSQRQKAERRRSQIQETHHCGMYCGSWLVGAAGVRVVFCQHRLGPLGRFSRRRRGGSSGRRQRDRTRAAQDYYYVACRIRRRQNASRSTGGFCAGSEWREQGSRSAGPAARVGEWFRSVQSFSGGGW